MAGHEEGIKKLDSRKQFNGKTKRKNLIEGHRILEWILKKCGVRAWTGQVLIIGSSKHSNKFCGFIKMAGLSFKVRSTVLTTY